MFFNIVHKYTPANAFIGITTIAQYAHTMWFEQQQAVLRDEYIAAQRGNTYARVTPLAQKPTSGRGLARDAMGSSVIWCDLDAYNTIPEAMQALDAYQFPPTLIVNSGYGLHAYWQLDRFYTDQEAIAAANKYLSHAFANVGGDSCFDLARVMRVPGTPNTKKTPHILATIAHVAPQRVYLLDEMPKAPLEQIVNVAWESAPLPDNFETTLPFIDAKLWKHLTDEKILKKIDRSSNDAYIATRLFGLGYDMSVVMSVLQHETWLSGAKYRDTQRYDYVIRTAQNAFNAFNATPDRFWRGAKFVAERAVQALSAPYMLAASTLWRYTDGVYHADALPQLREQLIALLGERWSTEIRDEIVQHIEDSSAVPVTALNAHANYVNVQNGMLELTTLHMHSHDPLYRSTIQLPGAFSIDADTTVVDAFVAQILPQDAIDTFWEYIGSVFFRDRYYPKKFAALIGPPHTGKSKLVEAVFVWLGGTTNVANMSLQTLADNRFAPIELFGKLCNIFSDLDDSEAQNSGMIKALTGDDYITGERKFKTPFSFKNVARLLFTSNSFPAVRSPDSAFFERALCIPCTNVFTVENADNQIVQKVTTQAACNGALLRMVQGARRLLSQKNLTYSASIAALNAQYRFNADTVAGFFQQCTYSADHIVTKQHMYEAYVTMCQAWNNKPVSAAKFFRRVQEQMDTFMLREEYKTFTTQNNEQGRAWCYVGLMPSTLPPAYRIVSFAHVTDIGDTHE